MKIGTYQTSKEHRVFVQKGNEAIDLLAAEERAEFAPKTKIALPSRGFVFGATGGVLR